MYQSFGKILGLLAFALAINVSSLIGSESIETVDSPSPIEKIEGDKAYLKPGTVFISANQIYLCIDQQMISLSSIATDAGGVYASLSEITAETHPKNDWICANCGTDNSASNKYCRICGVENPDFPNK